MSRQLLPSIIAALLLSAIGCAGPRQHSKALDDPHFCYRFTDSATRRVCEDLQADWHASRAARQGQHVADEKRSRRDGSPASMPEDRHLILGDRPGMIIGNQVFYQDGKSGMVIGDQIFGDRPGMIIGDQIFYQDGGMGMVR